jgi:dihydroorotate dehydrogenase (fumarate)
MANLSTTYMGIKLKNPLILGSCNLVMKPGVAEQLEEAGIGAIVYKSLFEEQIQLENLQISEDLGSMNTVMLKWKAFFRILSMPVLVNIVYNIEKLKKKVNIPVIASLNAIYESTWIEYAKELGKNRC